MPEVINLKTLLAPGTTNRTDVLKQNNVLKIMLLLFFSHQQMYSPKPNDYQAVSILRY